MAPRHLALCAADERAHGASTADAIADALAEITSVRGTRPPSEDEMSLAKASYPRVSAWIRNRATGGAIGCCDIPLRAA